MVGSSTHIVQPTNKIVVDGKNKHVQTMKIETVTNCYPGRLVIVGTNDDDVLVSAAADAPAIGWIGYGDTAKKYRPATITTIQVVNDQVGIINGPGIQLLACLAPGCTVTKGTPLMSASLGQLSVGVAGTNDIVASAEESITTTGHITAYQPIVVRSRI